MFQLFSAEIRRRYRSWCHVILTNGLYGKFTPNGDNYVVQYES